MSTLRNFRVFALLGAAGCASGVLTAVLYFQGVLGLEPCHLCIFQRVAMAATGVVFLVAAAIGPKGNGGRWVLAVITALVAGVGALIAARHVYIQIYGSSESCGGTLSFLFDNMSAINVIQMVLKGNEDCAKVDWTFLGQGMPFWTMMVFFCLIAWALAMPVVAKKKLA